MDVIPRPGRIVAPSVSLAARALRGGPPDPGPTRRALIGRGVEHRLYHYGPASSTAAMSLVSPTSTEPVLLVGACGSSARCLDLRPGGSLVEHLLAAVRPTYLLEASAELESWVLQVLPQAVRQVADRTGSPVHLVGWGTGGVASLFAAAAAPDLDLASVSLLGTPVDLRGVPFVVPGSPRGGRHALGATPISRLPLSAVATVLATVTRLADMDSAAYRHAAARHAPELVGDRARRYGQEFHRLLRGSDPASGSVMVGTTRIELARVGVSVLSIAAQDDAFASTIACAPVVDLVGTDSGRARFEVVPGGHLDLVAGPEASATTWRLLDDFFDHVHTGLARRRQQTPSGVPPGELGSNPRRRFSSGASRSLATSRSSGRHET